MQLLLKIVITAVGILAVAYLLPGVFVSNFLVALLVAVILSFLNLIVRPILVILTLPITIVTLGLFLIVINAFLLWITSLVIEGFDVGGFFTAIIAAVIISAVAWVGEKLVESTND